MNSLFHPPSPALRLLCKVLDKQDNLVLRDKFLIPPKRSYLKEKAAENEKSEKSKGVAAETAAPNASDQEFEEKEGTKAAKSKDGGLLSWLPFDVVSLDKQNTNPMSQKEQDDYHARHVSGDAQSIYFVGHSLGLQPRNTKALVLQELTKWAEMGVNGHFSGELPWMPIDDFVTAQSARLVGAKGSEVCVMNTLSMNLHVMFGAFYKPDKTTSTAKMQPPPRVPEVQEGSSTTNLSTKCTKGRYKIVYEKQCFPSDFFVFESQARLWNLDPEDALIGVEPEPETELVDEDKLVKLIESDREIAVVCLGGV